MLTLADVMEQGLTTIVLGVDTTERVRVDFCDAQGNNLAYYYPTSYEDLCDWIEVMFKGQLYKEQL